MQIAINQVDRTPAHATHPTHATRTPAPSSGGTATTASQTTSQSGSSSASSFSTVLAAASAEAAGTGATTSSAASSTGNASTTAVTTNSTQAATTSTASAADDPAGPLFGASPWVTNPTGTGPAGVTNYNPIYFATTQTAQTVAQMVGGTVVSMNDITSAPGSPFQQSQPNLMVQLPNGGLINPGLVADIYTHGWNQSFENQQVANEVAGAEPASGTIPT
jgi:hypothetical protein